MKRHAGNGAPADTIAAVATPAGRGAIGIIRLSGPLVRHIAEQMLGSLPPARQATCTSFRSANGQPIDQGLAIFFPAPHSFTGEDVLEIQAHGSAVLLDLLLKQAQSHGARLATPGEFSARAFLNDKIDLSQAEAIADLIASDTAQSARAALASLQGEFSRHIAALASRIDPLRAEVEAWLDFPDDEPQHAHLAGYAQRVRDILAAVEQIIAKAREGQLLRDGLRVVLVGRPNAGKSSLFNRLSRHERAIVSDVPGTTRDTLESSIDLNGLLIHLTDTAGLREFGDEIEQEGMRRTHCALREADHVLLLIPATEDYTEADRDLLHRLPESVAATIVRTKLDLTARSPGILASSDHAEIWLSALHGEGVDLLETYLRKQGQTGDADEGRFTARRRHVVALGEVRLALLDAIPLLSAEHELAIAAEQLRRARAALSLITGEYTTEDLLGEIFSTFCIGK